MSFSLTNPSSSQPKKRRISRKLTNAEIFALLRQNLPGPFSTLTCFSHIPLGDVQSHVNRPLETRRAEVSNRKGDMKDKVPRPPNAFILYRMAYYDQARAFCGSLGAPTGGPAISYIVGLSWQMEDKRVKEGFYEWARIESEKHAEAFPGWKFSPGKPSVSLNKGMKTVGEEDEVGVESEDTQASHGQRKEGQTQAPAQGLGAPEVSAPQLMTPLYPAAPVPAADMGFIGPVLLAASMAQVQNPYPAYPFYNFQPQQPVLCSKCACEVAAGAANQVMAAPMIPEPAVNSPLADPFQIQLGNMSETPSLVARDDENGSYPPPPKDVLAEGADMTPEELEELLDILLA